MLFRSSVLQIADQIACEMAPRPLRGVDYKVRQRPFTFGGDRALKREITWIVEARRVVHSVLTRDPAFLQSTERNTWWRHRVARLYHLLRRSALPRPPDLPLELPQYLHLNSQQVLTAWSEQALAAVRQRHEHLKSKFEQAVKQNLRRLRGRVRAHPQKVTAGMIQAALGTTPPQTRIWGISGSAPTGLELSIDKNMLVYTLRLLRSLRSSTGIQCARGTNISIQL